MTTPTRWQPSDYRVELPTTSLTRTLVEAIHRLVCRTTFDQPGFCLVDLSRSISSLRQRALMVELMRAMAEIERTTTGRRLAYQSATRFDQQGTTKLHRDGGPEECFLMLGYEPTTVPSEVALADSARCAADLGITETEFLEQHNPMFHEGEELLRPYLTRLDAFDRTASQILLINNSLTLSHHDGRSAWKGVLHTATILAPDHSASRVINSSLIVSLPEGAPEPFGSNDLDEFLTTASVLRRGYPVRRERTAKLERFHDTSASGAGDPATGAPPLTQQRLPLEHRPLASQLPLRNPLSHAAPVQRNAGD